MSIELVERCLEIAESTHRQIQPQRQDRLGDFGAYAHQDHLGAQQPCRLHNIEYPLGHLAINDNGSGNIEHQVADGGSLDGVECLCLELLQACVVEHAD